MRPRRKPHGYAGTPHHWGSDDKLTPLLYVSLLVTIQGSRSQSLSKAKTDRAALASTSSAAAKLTVFQMTLNRYLCSRYSALGIFALGISVLGISVLGISIP